MLCINDTYKHSLASKKGKKIKIDVEGMYYNYLLVKISFTFKNPRELISKLVSKISQYMSTYKSNKIPVYQ